MNVEFGEWLPDQPDHNNPCALAQNVYPSAKGYLTAKNSATQGSAALSARAQGVYWVKDSSGTNRVFAGDAADLYEITSATASAATATVVSATAGAYTTGAADFWEFARFGSYVIASNNASTAGNDMQFIDLDSGSAFAALGGAPPKARHLGVVRDFVVAGNTYDASDGIRLNRVRWCAIGDATSWTVSPTTQADYNDLPSGGEIKAVTSGEYGLVICDRSVYRMSYVGSPLVFQFDSVLPSVGTPAPKSVVQVENMVFFYAHDGFRVITSGSDSQKIGAEKVDRYFQNDVDYSNIHRTVGAVDPINKRIFWAYMRESDSSGVPSRMLCYAYDVGRWSELVISSEFVGTANARADTPEVVLFSSVHQLQCIDINSGTLGDNLTPTVRTGYIEPGGAVTLVKAMPLLEQNELAGSVTPAITAYYISDLMSTATSLALTRYTGATSGEAPVEWYHGRATGRYWSFSVSATSGWAERLSGVNVEFAQRGNR